MTRLPFEPIPTIPVDDDANLSAIKRNGQIYAITYRNDQRPQAMEYLLRWHRNLELDFNAVDLAVMGEMVRWQQSESERA